MTRKTTLRHSMMRISIGGVASYDQAVVLRVGGATDHDFFANGGKVRSIRLPSPC